MALNRFMHPRSPYYNNPPDFKELTKVYPSLDKYLEYDKKQTKHIMDFLNPQAIQALCCALLKSTFGLDVDIPIDRLIPRVPQRLNYVLWIEDLIERKEKAFGIDIGCGSCCIYALIACSLNPQWNMLVSDIDDVNINYATRNVERNNLNERIKIKKAVDQSVFVQNLVDPNEIYDFLMCNPPFYKNFYDAQGLENTRKPHLRHDPKSINTANQCEAIYDDGGEVGFVKKLIDESITIGTRIRVFTSMLGKKSSFTEIRKYLLYEKQIQNISEARFCQGHTMRWAIAWSFHEQKLANCDQFNKKEEAKLATSDVPIIYEVPKDAFDEDKYEQASVYDTVKRILIDTLQVEIVSENQSDQKLTFAAYTNTWSHQRRKRRELERSREDDSESGTSANNKRKKSPIEPEGKAKKLKSDGECLIKCDVEIKLLNTSIHLIMKYSGGQSKDYMNQILQFIRNKITKK